MRKRRRGDHLKKWDFYITSFILFCMQALMYGLPHSYLLPFLILGNKNYGSIFGSVTCQSLTKMSLCFFSTLPYIVLKTKQPLTVLTRTFNHHSGNFCHQENFPSNTIQFFKILVGQLFLNKVLAFQLPQMHAEKTIQDRNGQAINRRET